MLASIGVNCLVGGWLLFDAVRRPEAELPLPRARASSRPVESEKSKFLPAGGRFTAPRLSCERLIEAQSQILLGLQREVVSHLPRVQRYRMAQENVELTQSVSGVLRSRFPGAPPADIRCRGDLCLVRALDQNLPDVYEWMGDRIQGSEWVGPGDRMVEVGDVGVPAGAAILRKLLTDLRESRPWAHCLDPAAAPRTLEIMLTIDESPGVSNRIQLFVGGEQTSQPGVSCVLSGIDGAIESTYVPPRVVPATLMATVSF